MDNKINSYIYEDNIDFSNYTSDIKSIAIYIPNFYDIGNIDDIKIPFQFGWKSIINAKPLFNEHYQPRQPIGSDKYLGYYDLSNYEVIKKQIKIARSHGIYGFGIYYFWSYGKILFEKPLKLIYQNKDIDFNFLLIWRNDFYLSKNIYQKKKFINNKIKKKQKIKKDKDLIEDIEIYLKDSRYIKINKRPVIGISKPLIINKLEKVISLWRNKAREKNIGEIFIMTSINNKFSTIFGKQNVFDAAYEFPPFNILPFNLMKNENFYYYSGIIYRTIKQSINITNDFPIYRGVMLEWDDSQNLKENFSIFNEYSPEKFYIINKLIINWTRNHYNESNKFIIINSWNNWYEGSYLEPDIKNGYANLNALSKALFDLPFKNEIYNLSNLKNIINIAIQVHIYYEDLIKEIIDKINNIPMKFDLYITSTSFKKAQIIEDYVRNYSKAENYYIKIVENKGRDVLPFLTQLKLVIKQYKYICHIHSKKTIYSPKFGDKWRKYLYGNLLGSIRIISEIISDFENYEKLGFIFPETFYECIKFSLELTEQDRKCTNFILNKIFPGFKIGKSFDFPAGNMFWARVDAIYQIFEETNQDLFPKEKNQKSGTILHGIERVWIYLVKLNGFYYKKIFKYI